MAKLVPVTLSVKLGDPAVALGGYSDEMVAGGGTIEKTSAADVNAVDVAVAGVTTVMLAVPGLASSAAGTEAVSCVALMKIVERAEPFHCTVELAENEDPLTTNVNAALPAGAESGRSNETVGA